MANIVDCEADSEVTATKAHVKSRPFVIDPVYSLGSPAPVRVRPTTASSSSSSRQEHHYNNEIQEGWWIYGDGEFETYRLSVLRRRAKDAKLNVWYPGKFQETSRRAFFRISTRDIAPSRSRGNNSVAWLRFASNGKVKVYSNSEERLLYEAEAARDIHTVKVENTLAVKVEIETEVRSEDGEDESPPCIWMDREGYAASRDKALAGVMPQTCSWEWSSDGVVWSKCQFFPPVPGATYPHHAENPNVLLQPTCTDTGRGIHDFGVELLGHVVIECCIPAGLDIDGQNTVAPTLFVGESIAETMDNDPLTQEQSTELITQPLLAMRSEQQTTTNKDVRDQMKTWITRHPVAFRYARVVVPNDMSISISCRATFHPAQYKGAFACSDDKLTAIWMHSAYTLRLCMSDFILDGIKRDRLPWAGDLAVSLLSDAFTFADADIVAKSLTVLGRAGIAEKDVNGFVDYTLWWIICHNLFHLYFADTDKIFLHREWPRIKQTVDWLVSRCDECGLLSIDEDEGKDMVFIDWANVEKGTAVQVLWWYALGCGASIAGRVGSVKCVDEWRTRQEKVRDVLVELCWNDEVGMWTAAPSCQTDFSRHANILAVVSGLSKGNDLDRISEALLQGGMPEVKTPYMKTLECISLSLGGQAHAGLTDMRQYWGGMLDRGASTFWEAYDPNETEESKNAFYNRPYGRSLCHAWGAGPCYYIQEALLGIRPLSDGWKTWTCCPNLPPDLDWACATVPTPFGCIEIDLSEESLVLFIPGNTVMIMNGQSHSGPQKITICPRDDTFVRGRRMKEWSRPYRGWHYCPRHVIPERIQGYEDVNMTDVPTVYQLPDVSNKWYMSFIGFNGKGYQSFVAESDDLVTWTNMRLAFGFGQKGDWDYGGVVLGAYLYENYDIKAPRVLKRVDGKFWGLYGAYSKQGAYEMDPGYEGVAWSDDGIVWRRASDRYILSVHDDDTKDWEKSSIYQPWLLQDGDIFYNFYNAKQMPEWIEQIGMAISSDLMNWKRYRENPVLRVRQGGFDSNFVSDPKVFRDGDHWTMFYFGVGYNKAHIMAAFSDDLVRWTADPEPLYQAGGNASGLDRAHAHKISLVYNPSNDTFYMYYCAVGDAGRGIGLITSKRVGKW